MNNNAHRLKPCPPREVKEWTSHIKRKLSSVAVPVPDRQTLLPLSTGRVLWWPESSPRSRLSVHWSLHPHPTVPQYGACFCFLRNVFWKDKLKVAAEKTSFKKVTVTDQKTSWWSSMWWQMALSAEKSLWLWQAIFTLWWADPPWLYRILRWHISLWLLLREVAQRAPAGVHGFR